MTRTKILLDTDIGSDIDDAVCLAYLLANPACDLLGITTVGGEPIKRAQLASALCHVANRADIPIFPGLDDPFFVPQKQPTAPQASALPRWPHQKDFPCGEAIEFLRRTIRANPGEVVLLAIGPLTNIATLFMADREIPSLLKGLVLMNGVFTRLVGHSPTREWNALLDPTATALVFNARPKVHRSIGLDVTMRLTMPAAEVRRRFQTPLLRPVLDFAEVWFSHTDEITFHDPLAATTIFDADMCRFDRGRVEVETVSPLMGGYTHWLAGSDGPHEVAVDVDPQRFFSHYFSFFPEA